MANQSIYNAFARLWEHIILKIEEKPSLPNITSEDEGKFLKVSNGVATWTEVPSAEGVSF